MPTRRVEFFGAVGAGKTTLLKNLRAEAAGDEFYVFSAKRANYILKDMLARGRLSKLQYLLPLLPERLAQALTRHEVAAANMEMLAAEYPTIEKFVLGVLHERPVAQVSCGLAIDRMRWFIRDLSDLSLLQRHGSSGTYLFDESLIMRGMGFAYGAPDHEAALEHYLRFAPLPNAAIFVKAENQLLLRRVSARDGRGSPKEARTLESARIAELMHNILSGRIPVLSVSNSVDSDLHENIRQIQVFLRTLSPRKLPEGDMDCHFSQVSDRR